MAAHELRIQRIEDGTLRHPPVPALWKASHDDGTVPDTDYVVAAGTGTVYSFVVHYAPKVPGRSLPFVVALVELDEGVRMLGELRDVDPESVHIGMPVEVAFPRLSRIRRQTAMDALRVAPGRCIRRGQSAMTAVTPTAVAVGMVLPPLTIEATPTFVVASALATRDFQDVHHDRDLAH